MNVGAFERLRVRVNDELVLDAGTSEEVAGPDGAERLIRPPETTLFHQVLAYLQAKPDPALADRKMATRLVHASDPERVARVRADAERHPSRLFANALVNTAWRNGPVENVHAGRVQGYPLEQRRVTPAEERALMRFASEGMALGMLVCRRPAMEQPECPWPEQVLPYGLGSMMLITPTGWTLTETSNCACRPQPAYDPRRPVSRPTEPTAPRAGHRSSGRR